MQADLSNSGAFDEAMHGATMLCHVASPVIMNPAKGQASPVSVFLCICHLICP